MFFMIGVNQGRKDLKFHQVVICDICGSYGRYQVFRTYMVLSLFFIPCLKWGKKYYVQTTCCSTVYELDPGIGRRIASGEELTVTQEDLRLVQPGTKGRYRKCRNCGYETDEDFEYCPKCGSRLEQ